MLHYEGNKHIMAIKHIFGSRFTGREVKRSWLSDWWFNTVSATEAIFTARTCLMLQGVTSSSEKSVQPEGGNKLGGKYIFPHRSFNYRCQFNQEPVKVIILI